MMKAADVMVSEVITVAPDASVHDVAEVLLANRISAVPVVGVNRELVGIVSEGDLIRRIESETERRPSRWLALFIGNRGLAAEFVKSHAHKVADVMTRDVVTASPDTRLRDIAALMEKNGIKRVPIMRDGRLVGIVSRANLVQALATARREIKAAIATSDAMIREEVISRLRAEPWAKPSRLNIIVHDGAVGLWGSVESEAAKTAIRVAVELTPGVRATHDNIVVESFASFRNVVAA